jgi:alpha-L-fucosidase
LRPPEVKEINASDVELCEWPRGETYILFTGSDQRYAGDLQWATFEGTPRELLEHFFK